MRGQYTIEEQAEQLKEYLGCPCTYFPPMADDQPIMAAYRQALEHHQGQAERIAGQGQAEIPVRAVGQVMQMG